MRQKNIEGDVLIEFTVDTEGKVQSPRVVSSSRPEFERPALLAVSKWKYLPASQAGKPIAMPLKVPLSFRIGEGKTDSAAPMTADSDLNVKLRQNKAQASTE